MGRGIKNTLVLASLGVLFFSQQTKREERKMKTIMTSESVNIGHPDKTCDSIADAFLDAALLQDPQAQMAVECAIKNNLLMIYGESTTSAKISYKRIARAKLKEIGYKNHFKIKQVVGKQSPDIAHAVKQKQLMANDQGIVFGFACSDTKEYMPLPIMLAHALMQTYENYRRKNKDTYFADAKSQVSVEYEKDKPVGVHTVLLSVSHNKDITHKQIEEDMTQNVILPVLSHFEKAFYKNAKLIINPSGAFTIWGSFGDSGCVGRKIVVDTYGGASRVGGGCFSSKNATKVDRSGAYYARYIAKNLVANGLASKVEVALSYAIGKAKPLNINIDCFGTETQSLQKIYEIVNKNFNLSVSGMIKELNLLQPIYEKTSCYGHFGREEFPWENVISLKL